jgi:hypothetical protein
LESGLVARSGVGEKAGGRAGAEGRRRAGWEGAMVPVGWTGLTSVLGGDFRLAGLARRAVELIVAGGGVGEGGAVAGAAVGAVEGCGSTGGAELARGVLLAPLSRPSVQSVAHRAGVL